MKPLENIRVIDFTRFFAGPYCTQYLGDYGAEVIKVESLNGDEQRTQGPPFVGHQGVGFMAVNRNKKSVTLNMKTEEGKRLAKELIRKADVVVENFRNGVAERLGIGFEDCKALNPDIIYCSISGYGANGPKGTDPAFDVTVQAYSGFMSLNGFPDGEPVKPAVSICDLMTSVMAFAGIEGALLRRKNDPSVGAQLVQTSLFETISAYLTDASVRYQLDGSVRRASGSFHANIAPFGAFKAKNGYVAMAAGNDHLFKRFCEVMDMAEEFPEEVLTNSGIRYENRELVRTKLEEHFADYDVDELCKILNAGGIPCSPVNPLDKAIDSEQSEACGMKITLHHEKLGDMHLVGPAVKQPGVDVSDWTAPPEIGEHNEAVLKGILGLGDEELGRLRRDGVIA